MAETKPMTLTLAKPRGFCAGVDRAVLIVEEALKKFGAPVYVRHEIVHNKRVVDGLRDKGAVFVDELDAVPDDRPVIFSAHGVPKAVPQAADSRGLNWLDATCPLVSKVHIETERHFENNRHILLIGHAGHPEVVGTMGQVPEGAITLIETISDAETVSPPDGALAYATQTTLSVSDTADIIATLKARFPDIAEPHKDDICYATTNRQRRCKIWPARPIAFWSSGQAIAPTRNALSKWHAKQAAHAPLIAGAEDIDWAQIGEAEHIGLTAGASAPEEIIQEVIDAFAARFALSVREMDGREEHA